MASQRGVERLSVDEARLRPHLRAQAAVFRREYERATREDVDTSAPQWKVPAGDDLERLRGLPCVARGVGGVAPGTDPLRALLAKETRLGR